ncbi:peptidylprolyl isomerase [Novacetimonas hansenii]|uniref:Parvulin-like PPIase n=3 Tax=Novacetimonas hansenii TaxID=436 RepID=A0ABQ0SD10_NOVHA|nr:peptidylprolyl isomerase [Novacetimonas hansenii ATCC 23769]RFP00949.1 peptidylprolyl isomerase [Novacetimonas hansenii]GAN85325.1 peptidyl-prolyl cis-trans isomerase [Novacetimonas hansenii JCM 7643]GBQ57793.1 peptidyl-prolyl cis-trans isomerase [Novacetimonas hansenii NRIC 0243]CUW48118.1 putative parvulin-type peptidyl-prolyl cis-trans isomerase precursor [Novacetimonas hansenii]
MRTFGPAKAIATMALLASTIIVPPALAAGTAPAASKPAAATAPADTNPRLASVNGQDIRLNDIRQAIATMPDQLRKLPENVIIPILLNQLVDQKAIQIVAEKSGLAKQPDVQHQMEVAAQNALQNAYLSSQVTPGLTDDAVKAYYDKNYANKPGAEEIHARHILVPTEEQANDIIKQLKGGANFADLATKLSKDPGSAKQNGGDLGWFKKGDMLPAFWDAASTLQPNSFSQTPVHTQYGWHVIQVLGKRTAATPTLDSMRDQIRQKLIQEGVQKAVSSAVGQVKIVRYGPDGKALPDNAPTPPPAAAH